MTTSDQYTTGIIRVIFAILFMTILSSYAQSSKGTPRLMQGPMVGSVKENEIIIWVRANGDWPVVAEYGKEADLADAQVSDTLFTEKSADYTGVIKLSGLQADSDYYYRVKVNGKVDKYLENFPPFKTKTAPEPGTKKNFRVAFGSCPRFQDDRLQPIWGALTSYAPQLFFWTGDNIYGDALDADILREEYRRQRDVYTLQPFMRSTAQLAIWDDHDFGLNDHDRTNPVKEKALVVFKEYWANPAYGLPAVPGVFFRYTYGAVDFFFLDIRYYRDPNESADSAEKTMLGSRQKDWLKDQLIQSKAVFKVLVSGSGWSKAKSPEGDSWAAFIHERNALFDFIRDNQISGVVLISGDTHVGELNVIPWSEHKGYDFYDLASSPLAQPTTDSWLERRPEKRARPVYFSGPNSGIIDFSFDKSARLTFQLIDTEGRIVWKPLVLNQEDLVNGVVSWPEKIDKGEQQRQENYDNDKGYYDPQK